MANLAVAINAGGRGTRAHPLLRSPAAAMPARTCPSCSQPLQVLFHGRLELDRCLSCEATWVDRDELAPVSGARGAPELTRDHPVGRCPGCAGLLWSARVDGLELLSCITCAGCFVTDNQLRRAQREPQRRPGTQSLQFVCVGCKDRYPFEKATRVTTGLACAHCAESLPRWQPPPPPVQSSAPGAPLPGAMGPFETVVDFLMDLLTLP
ncbi:zf-TFIIB domain-containing protein [Pyxidicoccus caerfyrddinensis]|uniref:TFIIB-type zinc ribbon-containing protein n=1 Tax=Pyxidicoccus caerfyrddinensis TaxID=2709663 RepID=UPI0013DBA371|nr:zf-TFIIB domain-containing protein [Pyxidicoccus caerfyrddinensis]